jgi:hypothetical protein
MNFVHCYLPLSDSSLLLASCQPFCLSSICLLIICMEINSLPLPLLWCAFSILSPLLCASFPLIQVFFFLVGSSVCLGDYAGLSCVWLREYHVMLGAHLLGLLNVSQAGLELMDGSSSSSPVFSV